MLTTAVYPPSSTHWIDDLLVRICLWMQLTPTQRAEAEEHYGHVGRWLSAPESALAPWRPEIFPQGSLRIGTTVRPLSHEEFDLDLVCLLAMRDGYDPIAVLNLVEKRLRDSDIFKPMVERKNRCIRLNYAKQFHMDILPARPDQTLGGTCVLVPDRAAKCWKESNPRGYAGWFDQRGIVELEAVRKAASVEPLPPPEGAEEKNPLQLSVQLFKRARDIRFVRTPDVAPISTVLTTLAGQHYRGELHPLQALSAIAERIVASIPAVGRLYVLNPANPKEDLSERWDNNPDAYRAFVNFARELSRELHQLAQADGMEAAKKRLEKLFGGDVAERAIRDQAGVIERMRGGNALRVVTGSGALTSVGSAAVAVKKNTFYGS
jgi:hypothetical protein